MFNQDITPYQNFSILIIVSFAFQSLLMPILLYNVDGPVGWISVILAAIIIYIVISKQSKLLKRYENITIVGISNKLLPLSISKLIGTYYILMFLSANSILLKDFSEQIKLMMLYRTPISTIIMAILLTSSYASKKGIQTIGHIASFSVLFALIPYMLIIVFSTYYADYSNVFPISPLDIGVVIKAVPNTFLAFFGFVIIPFSYCKVSDPSLKDDKNIVLKKYVKISMLLYVFSYILIVVKFGYKESVNLIWPFLSIMKFENIPGFFFESTEIVGLSFQIIVTFCSICALSYFTNLALQETFETKENGYFTYIQIPILYILTRLIPGMYMMFPIIQIVVYALSAINLLIPLILIYKDSKLQKVEEV